MTPTSLNIAWPQSVAQPEKLILNLRGRRWASGLRRKCRKAASAHGADVEHLVGAGAGEVAALHVADGVAAGLAGGEAHRGEVAHRRGHPLERHEVELQVLAGGDVAPAPGVLVGDVGEHVDLVGCERSVRHLHPQHLVVPALPLAVDAVGQTEDAEHVLVQVAGQVALELDVELLDVGSQGGIDLTLQHGLRLGFVDRGADCGGEPDLPGQEFPPL